MAKYNLIRSHFYGGEISPRAQGRSDYQFYNNSCRDIINGIVTKEGGITKRAGTRFESNCVEDEDEARTIGFEFSETEKYLFVFKVGTVFNFNAGIRDWADPILPCILDISDTSITIDPPTTLSSTLRSGSGVNIPPSAAWFWPGFKNKQDLYEANFRKVQDSLIVLHPNYPTAVFTRVGFRKFEFRPHYTKDGFLGRSTQQLATSPLDNTINPDEELVDSLPYILNESTEITMKLITPGPFPITNGTNVELELQDKLTGLAYSGVDPFRFIAPPIPAQPDDTHIGAVVRIERGGFTEAYLITNVQSPTRVDAFVIKTPLTTTTPPAPQDGIPTDEAVFSFSISSWNNLDKFPQTSEIFNARLILGGSSSFPSTIWSSKVGDFSNFNDFPFDGGTQLNSDAQTRTIDGDSTAIRWMDSGKKMVIGTENREYLFDVDAAGDLFITPESANGSEYIQSKRVGNGVYFVDVSGNRIMEFVFNFQEDAFKASDLTLFASHIPEKNVEGLSVFNRPKIEKIEIQRGRQTIIWVLDNNKNLFGLTRDRDIGINAFHRHIIGGNFGGEPAQVLSMAIIQDPNNLDSDDLWMAVKRTIDGVTKTFIERIGREFFLDAVFNTSTNIDDKPVYVDSALYIQQADTTAGDGITYDGLDHLEGEEVQVLAEGINLGFFTVSGGEIVLPKSFADIVVGLGYSTFVNPTTMDIGSRLGSSQGRPNRPVKYYFWLTSTTGLRFGVEIRDELTPDGFIEIDFNDKRIQPMDEALPLFTGIKEVQSSRTFNRENNVVLLHDFPLPFYINAIIERGIMYD